jgi:Zn-dependent protease/predicted transcriptional regulator
MKSQIKLGTVFGVELGLHYSWVVIALLITFSLAAQFHATNRNWSDGEVWATAILTGVLFFACLLAHELSHALVAKARGLPIHKITLFLLGGVAQIEKEASDPNTEFWMAIVGPFTSAVIGFLLLGLAHLSGWSGAAAPDTPGTALLLWLGYINLALAAFNMIPGFPLDGGRVLRAILWWSMHDVDRATRAAARVGQFIAVLFIAFGIFRFFAGAGLGGLWLAFIGWFLLQAAGASYLQVRGGTLLAGLKVRDLMLTDFETTTPDTSLQEFVHDQLMRTGRRCFVVVENGELMGLITANEVRNVDPKDWYFKKVESVMLPVERIHSVSPDLSAREALEIMVRENVHQLPVVSGSHIEGIIAERQILQAMRSRSELSDITHLPKAA